MEPSTDLYEELREYNPEALTPDGFEEAYLGFTTKGVAVYSRRKCIEILMSRDKMSAEDAEEFFSFNTEGAHVGEFTPLFLYEHENG